MTDGGCVQEVHDRSLEDAVQAARQAWSKLLGRISIDDVGAGYTAQQEQDWLTGFYSSLYRAAKFPRKLFEQDADGNTVHYSPNTGKVLPGVLSADQGFWDAYRTTYSLLAVWAPERMAEMMEGWLAQFRETGEPLDLSHNGRGGWHGVFSVTVFLETIVVHTSPGSTGWCVRLGPRVVCPRRWRWDDGHDVGERGFSTFVQRF
eukprot:COSAG01_NODE_24102_length_790_cov_1.370478_2_plen_204_part_00